jgi:glycosyltransferase involved in cell wall biosynthesis
MKITHSIINKIDPSRTIRAIGAFAHERFDANLAKIPNFEFYCINVPHSRRWDERKSLFPDNYFLSDTSVMMYRDFDYVICENPLAFYQPLKQISMQANLPIINIWHTNCPPGWTKEDWDAQPFNNDINVFITKYNELVWTGQLGQHHVIDHCIDTKLFATAEMLGKERENTIFNMVNDFANRGREHGLSLFKHLTEGLPVKLLGDSPGISKPAQNIEHLVEEIATSSIFLSSSISSPLSMSILEAASCGLALVLTSCSGNPDYFNEDNAFIFSPQRPQDGREYLVKLLQDKDLRDEYGKRARAAVEKFTVERFVTKWEQILRTR